MNLTYGSVCSGIEAATAAWHPLGWEAKFFSEIEKFPSAVLAHHYGSNMPGEPLSKNGIPNYGDFTQIGPDAGPVDILVGGTPCQSFSVAGKRLGLDDPRGNLALEFLALARRLRTRWIVWENVPGVVSSVTDEEDGDGDIRSGLEGREAGDEWIEESDFATFLSFVRECGFGFAYRVLDAQFIRVDGFERAVPQRRRRVFLVGYLGDWRRAAAVLLEPEGLRGDSAPCRKAGQGATHSVAPSLVSSGQEVERLGETRGQDPAVAEQISSPVASCLDAHFGDKMGLENQHINAGMPLFVATRPVAEVAPTIKRDYGKGYGDGELNPGGLVAHSLRVEGFDASEEGTGRGTPIVPVEHPFTLAIRGRGDSHQLEYRTDGTANAVLTPNGGRAGIGVGAVAFAQNNRDEVRLFGGDGQTVGALAAEPGMEQQSYVAHAIQAGALRENPDSGPDGVGVQEGVSYTLEARAEVQAVQSSWAVRRLTPTECERLQGFPDGFTNIPWNGKPTAADGPRYKALGNSMAVNAMRWIGQRIDLMEKLISEGRI